MANMGSEIETEVLVVGGDGAGLAAALSAAEEGASVIVAEKSGSLGGTTALSIGSITASGTSYRARRGFTDCEEDFLEDIARYNGPLDRATRRKRGGPPLRSLFTWTQGSNPALRADPGFGAPRPGKENGDDEVKRS